MFMRYYGPWDMGDSYRSINPDKPEFWNRENVVLWGAKELSS